MVDDKYCEFLNKNNMPLLAPESSIKQVMYELLFLVY